MTDDEKLIHNERTKITGTWLNTLASGAIITGVLAPTIAIVFGLHATAEIAGPIIVISGLVWLFTGIALHFIARWLLGRLRA